MDAEHLVEAGDLEGAAQTGVRTGEPEVAVAAPSPGEPVDDHPKAGGVDELDPAQIEHDRRCGLLDQRKELGPEGRDRGDVDLALRHQDLVLAPFRHIEARVDRRTLPRYSSRRRAEMNASWGTSTRPMFFMRRL